MQFISTGHITYSEFQQCLKQFIEWWAEPPATSTTDTAAANAGNAAVAAASLAAADDATGSSIAAAGQPCWNLAHINLPVVRQEVVYAEMERVVTRPACQPSSTAVVSETAAPSAAATLPAAAAEEAASSMPAMCISQESPAATDGISDAPDVYDLIDEACITCFSSSNAEVMNPAAAAAAAAAAAPGQQMHIHRYSIVWHDSYQVPVLYIQAHQPDGSCLSLDDLLTDLRSNRKGDQDLDHTLDHDDLPIITAVMHPLLRCPCFMLHPCLTADCMKLLMHQATAAATDAADIGSRKCAQGSSSSSSSGMHIEEFTAASITSSQQTHRAAVEGVAAVNGQQQQQQVLLDYMVKWFSLVAGLLGFSLVSKRFVV